MAVVVALGLPAMATAEEEVVLVIRAGSLTPAEESADPLAAPRLRRLLTEGASLPAISLAQDLARRGEDDPAAEGAALETLLPPAVIAHLREQGISMVTVDPRQVAAEGERDAGGEGKPLTERQAAVLARLHELVGAPPAAGDEERAAVRRFREILGLGGAAAGVEEDGPSGRNARRGDGDGSDAAAPAEPKHPVVERVLGALEKGARLVVVLEHVDRPSARDDNEGATNGPAERDRLLGEVLDEVRARSGASLLLLSLPDGGRGLLVAHGPRVRPGWIVPERIQLEDVTPTLLWLLGSKPFDRGNRREPIDEILEQ